MTLCFLWMQCNQLLLPQLPPMMNYTFELKRDPSYLRLISSEYFFTATEKGTMTPSDLLLDFFAFVRLSPLTYTCKKTGFSLPFVHQGVPKHLDRQCFQKKKKNSAEDGLSNRPEILSGSDFSLQPSLLAQSCGLPHSYACYSGLCSRQQSTC